MIAEFCKVLLTLYYISHLSCQRQLTTKWKLGLIVLQCFLYAHAFKMASCVTFLLYYKVVFLDFFLEYKHNNGMTLSPDLELK